MKKIFFLSSFFFLMLGFMSLFLLLSTESSMIFFMKIMSSLEVDLSVEVMIDKFSLIFSFTVCMVSSMIIIFSFFYFKSESEKQQKKFLLLLFVFISSMIIMSLSSNLFGLMIGWDGLGFSSFLLIIFYQNWKSFSSSMVTFLSNRTGDVFFILSIIIISLNSSSLSSLVSESWMKYMVFLLSIGVISKSAQYPYSFWLPQAMAAPTPVSALVHSSTLVTAGIYAFIRFDLVLDGWAMKFVFFLSCITIIIAGSSSMEEKDMKKIIALSTMCHISLMMMFVILGDYVPAMIHMISHAFFKSLLFMLTGYLINFNLENQDIRYMTMSWKDIGMSFPMILSLFSMMGLPFLSGYYSKELLLTKSSYNLPSMIFFISFMINSTFSCAYSFRMMKFIFFSKSIMSSTFSYSSNPFGKIFLFWSIFSSWLGGMLILLLEEECLYYVDSFQFKTVLILFCMIGVIFGFHFSSLPYSFLKESWKMNFIYEIFLSKIFSLSNFFMWSFDEKGSMALFTQKTIKLQMKLSSFSSLKTLFLYPTFLIKSVHFLVMCMIILF